ncbi:hypothetical protein [Sphingomonas colocasiae]|uniref:Uncharacterized protein n=1 Tax=Sphingomonas colocasiae TaxID=1848973 RepID=A0ABS7PIC7_9SPHN|nr:hypothetical protein [Sphingomonas colocasiae]MBY8821046.1 hypothetical protein [Sphingomonas colocasiae]
MGNRGDIHASDGSLGERHWAHKAWIYCTLDGGGRRVMFDTPGRYYPLFFHDEAVALAAGHRPCGSCLREDWKRFKAVWSAAIGQFSRPLRAPDIDEALRLSPMAERFSAGTNLPDGTFVELDKHRRQAALIWDGQFFPWEQGGYREPLPFKFEHIRRVLTPEPILRLLAEGFQVKPKFEEAVVSDPPHRPSRKSADSPD